MSVAANIAEGSARESLRDRLHFLYIASGSLTETQHLLHLSSRLGYVVDRDHEAFTDKIRSTIARLHGLIKQYGKHPDSQESSCQ